MPIKKLSNLQICLFLFAISLLLYLYKFPQVAVFDADQDYYGNQYLSIVKDHKQTLLGIEASVGGLYVGPLYTYASSLIYAVSGGNPISVFLASILIGALQAPITYLLFAKLHNKKTAIFAGLFVLFSYALWLKAFAPSVIGLTYISGLIFFYLLAKLSKNPKTIIYLGIICGLALHLHISLFLFIPSTIVYLILKRPKIPTRYLILAVITIIIFASPLILFELRHNFFLTKNLVDFFAKGTATGHKNYITNLIGVNNSLLNVYAFFLDPQGVIGKMLVLLTIPYFIIKVKKNQAFQTAGLIIALSIIIFSLYFGSFSDYYFYFLIAPFLFVFASLCASIYDVIRIRYFFLIAIALIIFTNVTHIQKSVNPYNYFIKQKAVSYLKNQVRDKKVKVYFDTELGLSVGFNYLLRYHHLNLVDANFEELYQIAIKGDKKTPGAYFQQEGVPNTIRVINLNL